MESQRLNVFQRIMRLWDRVYPYNAAQVLHVRGAMELDRLAAAWNGALAALGLGTMCVEGDRFRHEVCNGHTPAQPLRVVEPGVGLEQFISQELNRRFEIEAEGRSSVCPFRPFVLQGDGAYYAGVVYHHWVADSVSMRMVLREWFYRMYEPARARVMPLQIPRGGYWHFFGPGSGRWNLDDGLFSTLRLATRFGNARRIQEGTNDYRVACSVQALPDGMIEDLREAARRQQVTLNDVFLAALAEACDRCGATPSGPGRQELALGTIVDLRPSCGRDLSEIFGLFLGFTTVVVRPQALHDWESLLRTVARQSAWQKRCGLAQASLLRMAAAVLESRFLSPQNWVRFYLKHMPLAAGISNVNLGRTWAADYHPGVILDYLRFSPTGPALPVVFTPSSLGQKSHVAVTYRAGLVGEDGAARMIRSFVRRLEGVAAAETSRMKQEAYA